jgi:hypothetical protein
MPYSFRSASQACRRAPPGAPGPPRSRSAARRRTGSPDSSRTHRSCRPARGRGASGRGGARRGERDRGHQDASGVGARARRVSSSIGLLAVYSVTAWTACSRISRCRRPFVGLQPGGDWMSEEWMNTQFSVSRARPTDDASDATRCLPSRRDLGHRTRRGARTPLLQGRAHPPVVTIEGYDDAPQRPALSPLALAHGQHLCMDLRCPRPPTR